ncbi:MAG TPA: hypothetical protein VH157_00730 [Bryobacteraceae bacterium]|nr:hypothetical protein [Bryobacteraceae bacterium]
MRHLPVLTIACVLAMGAIANAQYPGPYGPDRRQYYDRDDRYRNRGDLFGRVRSDLERAESNSGWNGSDRHRFSKVREELSEFQRSGNRHELNDAISALQHVVDSNRLAYQDREMLAQDLYALRDFRARNGWR